jgi:hypothetical protein
MPINTETLNKQLYKRLSKYKSKPLDAEGNVTPVEDEADVFKFTFSKDGKDYGTVFATIDDNHALTVYYNDDVTESPSGATPDIGYDDSWTGLLKQLKSWAMHNQLSWKLKDRSHLEGDMARRNHMNKKDKIAEGYYPMGNKASYSDNVPSVKIVIEHTRKIEEGEQRYRNINKIFLENQLGERFLLDTKKPGIARVYARHIAEGGKVNDDRWGHIQGLCEEYQKMAGFVRATRNNQFNESAQKLVNEAINHYQGLRESLSKMTGKRGYEAYFESWTPPLMEDETDTSNLNELFVQETLDPRIESVMPILSRLQKRVAEMKEVSELAEWADSLIEGEGGPEASEEPVDADMGNDTFGDDDGEDAPEDDLGEGEDGTPQSHQAQTTLKHLKKASYGDRADAANIKSGIAGFRDRIDMLKRAKDEGNLVDEEESLTSNNAIGIPEEDELVQEGKPSKTDLAMAYLKAVVMAPTGTPEKRRILNWQQILSNQFDIEMDPATLAQMLPQFDSMLQAGKLDKLQNRMASRGELEIGESQHGVEEGMLDGSDDVDSPVAGAITRRILSQRSDLLKKYGPVAIMQAIDDVADFVGDVDEIGSSDVSGWIRQVEQSLGGVDEGIIDTIKNVGGKVLNKLGHGSDEDLLKDLQKKAGIPSHAQHGKPNMAKPNEKEEDEVSEEVDMGQYDAVKSSPKDNDDDVFKKFREKIKQYGDELGQRQGEKKEKEVDEDLDADQKRVGQLGPTSKVKNNNIGKLVGANENFINTVDQAVVSEMDKSQTPPGRDDYTKGPEGKATPITPKKMADDAKKVLDKEKVKEGQSDLDRILIIMNHRR